MQRSPAAGVNANMKLSPSAAFGRPVLFKQPFASAVQFQSSAIDDQVKIAGLVSPGHLNRQSARPPAQRRMIRDGQVDLQHSHDRANQPFALAKRQSKHRSQSQRGFDGKVRIMTLTARRCSWLRLPTCNRIRGKPDCQASAITEANVIFAPVCNPMALARNMPSAFRMKLERHDRPPTRKSEAFCAGIP